MNRHLEFLQPLVLIRGWPFLVSLLLGSLFLIDQPLYSQSLQDGVSLPDGFAIVEVAGPKLADDIYSMTIDPAGNVYVAGRGYIKKLNDHDQDGVFDDATLFSKLPANGSQGMLATGQGIYCTGDAGLLFFRDQNRDHVADGPPETLLKTRTGVEHGSHALRMGPDGWLYLLVGNATPFRSEFASSVVSPIKQAYAGFLMRIDLQSGRKQVVADGFRNAYDFDFNDLGEIFVYDSDGERDISLPWYRPTRVFHIRPGDDAGWVNVGWKRPSNYLDMPRVIASLGRGSPTGVAVYRNAFLSAKKSSPEGTADASPTAFRPGKSFPAIYKNAILVGDWTFGRVVALCPESDGSYRPVTLATSSGSFGFAVTDLVVDQDGSLLVSVGGRGTRGAVYRIFYQAEKTESVEQIPDARPATKAARVGQQRLNSEQLAGPIHRSEFSLERLTALVNHASLQVSELAMGQLLIHPELDQDRGTASVKLRLLETLALELKRGDAAHIGLVRRVVGRLDPEWVERMITTEPSASSFPTATKLLIRSAVANDRDHRKTVLIDAIELLPKSARPLDLIRVAQLMLGGCEPNPADPMFAGYQPRLPMSLTSQERQRIDVRLSGFANELRQSVGPDLGRLDLRQNGASGPGFVLGELGRLAAMLSQEGGPSRSKPVAPGDQAKFASVVESMLAIHAHRSPDQRRSIASTIHWLAIFNQVGDWHSSVKDKGNDSRRILGAACLAVLDQVGADPQLIDRNFMPRFLALMRSIDSKTPRLAADLGELFEGTSENLVLLNCVRDEGTRQKMLDQVVQLAQQTPNQLSIKHLEALQKHRPEVLIKLLPELITQPQFSASLVKLMGQLPVARWTVIHRDLGTVPQSWLADALESARVETLKFAAVGLRRWHQAKLPEAGMPAVLATRTIQAAYRLNWSQPDVAARDQLILLLRMKERREFGYQLKAFELDFKQREGQQAALDQWRAFIANKYQVEVNVAEAPTLSQVYRRMSRLRFADGDAKRGSQVYHKLGCAICHDAGARLGPRLEGIGKRFSRKDLLAAIIAPNDQVPDRYQTTVLSTTDGNALRGMVVYDSNAGVVLQDASGMTINVPAAEIDERTTSKLSLMPENLLNTASDQECVDLIKYLESR